MWPVALALAATVASLCWMGFFMMGSLPLLILKHDTPLDARFVRGLFNLYYRAMAVTAAIGLGAYALAGRPVPAAGMAVLAVLAWALRRVIVGRMDRLREVMTATDGARIAHFRRLHVGGMLLNVVQLGAVAFSLTRLAL